MLPHAVVVADEWPLVCLGIVHALRRRGVQVVADTRDGEDALRLARLHAPAFLVVGPVRDLAATEVIRRSDEAKTVVLVDAAGTEQLAAMAAAGADALLLRSVSADELLDAVERVAQGERVISPALIPILVAAVDAPLAGESAVHQNDLTRKELEVLARLAEGRTNREIAEAMFVSPATIKTHLSHLYTKLGVTGRQGAIAQAIARGLLR